MEKARKDPNYFLRVINPEARAALEGLYRDYKPPVCGVHGAVSAVHLVLFAMVDVLLEVFLCCVLMIVGVCFTFRRRKTSRRRSSLPEML